VAAWATVGRETWAEGQTSSTMRKCFSNKELEKLNLLAEVEKPSTAQVPWRHSRKRPDAPQASLGMGWMLWFFDIEGGREDGGNRPA
jgi:hypothetical protein